MLQTGGKGAESVGKDWEQKTDELSGNRFHYIHHYPSTGHRQAAHLTRPDLSWGHGALLVLADSFVLLE